MFPLGEVDTLSKKGDGNFCGRLNFTEISV